MSHRETPPVANPMCVLREDFDDWSVLFNPDTAEAVGVNAVGVAVWQLCDGAHSVDQIIEAVRERFDEVPREARTHVLSFLAQLESKGFIGHETTKDGSPKP